jgi:hypothetical protein
MYCSKQFSVTMNSKTYNVNLDVEVTRSEFDRDTRYSVVDESSIVLEDEDGNLVEPGHEDYDDLVEEVCARDYEPEMY